MSESAATTPVTDALPALRSTHVYVGTNVTVKLDTSLIRQAVQGQPVYLAVYAAGAGDPRSLALELGSSLGSGTIGVIVGNEFRTASNLLCGYAIKAIADRTFAEHKEELKSTNDATGLFRDFAADVLAAPRQGRDCAAGGGQTASAPADSGPGAWPWVVGGLGVAGAAGGGALVLSRRRRRRREMEERRAEVMSLYDRLGADVQNLDPGDDAVARQALVDASERYTATGSLLSHADTPGEFEAARRAALEGLQAARTVRTKRGLDPGPELPPISPRQGEQLTAEREVNVGGKNYQGYPDYTPGAPYYYGGGAGVPGGWYSFPFWETLLLGSVLSGGLGGFGGGWGGYGGGGYGAGYDQGFDAGRESDREDGGGGGWDSGGGGGWDSGGGGDWGGGGGDSGGGSW